MESPELFKIKKKNQPRLLITAVPGIGDALLATPLIRSLRNRYPEAQIDLLVRLGSEEIVLSNPDINTILTFPRRPKVRDYVKLYKKILRRYDIAISTSPSDRSFINSMIAAPTVFSVAPKKSISTLWKYLIAQHIVELNPTLHTVQQNLQLIEPLTITKDFQVFFPSLTNYSDSCLTNSFKFNENKKQIVIHIMPGSDYKVWPVHNWQQVIQYLVDHNFEIFLTGGNSQKELEVCDYLTTLFPDSIHNCAGKLSFEEVSWLIQNCVAYIGTDTSTTHLAAATGCKTFAIYGPSNVLKWAPWPKGYRSEITPFQKSPGAQTNGNVTVIRGECRCEDFSRHCTLSDKSTSRCLELLESTLLIQILEEHLIADNYKSKNNQCLLIKSNNAR